MASPVFVISVGAALIAAAVYHYHGSVIGRAASIDLPWQQPVAAGDHYPELLAIDYWDFDFGQMEDRFTRFIDASSGELVLDGSLARQFQQSIDGLPAYLSAASLERISLLLRKSYPAPAGEQLAQLFPAMYRYHGARGQVMSEAAGTSQPDLLATAAARFETDLRLQREHFPPSQVERLFAEQNRLSRYLLERRRLREDATLSETDRREALQRLQRRFRDLP